MTILFSVFQTNIKIPVWSLLLIRHYNLEVCLNISFSFSSTTKAKVD